MDDAKKAVCEMCKRLVPVSSIKFVMKGKDSTMPACSQCRSAMTGKTPRKIPEEIADGKRQSVQQGREEKRIPSSKPVHYCERCRYKFGYDPKGRTDLMCPFCGKADKIVLHKIPGTDELLRQSEGYM